MLHETRKHVFYIHANIWLILLLSSPAAASSEWPPVSVHICGVEPPLVKYHCEPGALKCKDGKAKITSFPGQIKSIACERSDYMCCPGGASSESVREMPRPSFHLCGVESPLLDAHCEPKASKCSDGQSEIVSFPSQIEPVGCKNPDHMCCPGTK